MSADTAKKLEDGRRCTGRLIVEIAAARKAWAIFEALNGREDADRANLRASVSKLGLSTSANAITMALVRDTLLTLFRITDPPGDDKLTLCRISAYLQDANVVTALVADARKWSASLPYSQSLVDSDETTCRAHTTLIKDLVPPKWDAGKPPADPRIFDLRTKLKNVRDHVLAHSVDTKGAVMPHRVDMQSFLALVSELVDKTQLIFRGSAGSWKNDFEGRLREATEFWDYCEEGLTRAAAAPKS